MTVFLRRGRWALGWIVLFAGAHGVLAGGIAVDDAARAKNGAVTLEDVARLPFPGTAAPGATAFSADRKSVTYLYSEDFSLNKVLWRADIAADGTLSQPRVVARPPGAGAGNTDANLSAEEILRRERQRERSMGLSQVIRAEKADNRVFPIQGDLYLQIGDQPPEQLTKTPSPEIDPRFSPDAKMLAYVRDQELWVMDLKTRRETQLTHGARDGVSHGLAEFMAQEEMDRFHGYWWAPDGLSLLYQETDERHIPKFTILHDYEDKPHAETHAYPFSGAKNARVRLGIVPVGGGVTQWLDQAFSPDKDAYLADADWTIHGGLILRILSRDQSVLNIVRVDPATGKPEALWEERGEPWVNLSHDWHYLKDGNILTSSERSGFRHIYLHDRAGKVLRTVTSGPWAVDKILAADEERGEIWFAAGRENPLEQHVYRVSYQADADAAKVVKVTELAGTHTAVVAKDGNHWIDTFSSLDQPPITRVYDRSGKVLGVLQDAAQDPRLKTKVLPAPRLTEFQSHDGVTLYGAYYAPYTDKAKTQEGMRSPLIVMVYGGPHVQTVTNSWAMTSDLAAQFFRQNGFAVWKMDNRGSARRGAAFEAALARNMGAIEVRDQAEGVKFVCASFPEVDPNRVGITGGSYGGYMTLRSLQKAPQTFHAGVAVAPVTEWEGYDTCYTERYMGTPQNNTHGYHAASVLSDPAGFQGKLLIIHGMIDENVHYRHTTRLMAKLIEAGKNFEVMPLPLSRHSSRKESDRKAVYNRTLTFFRDALMKP